MTWWYENEEEDMPRKITLVAYDKEGKPFHKDVVVPETTEEARRLEEEMEFDKSRVYTALNADELRAGDKVIVADTMADLKREVCYGKENIKFLNGVLGEDWRARFDIGDNINVPLAYLVERVENCTNCEGCVACIKPDKTFRCDDYEPKNKKEIDMNWNYVSEGKLPEKQEMGTSDRVVVAVKGYNIVDIGYYDYELEAWFVDGNRYPVPVYAWMEVKPPKVEA